MSLKPGTKGFGLGAGLITIGGGLLAIVPLRESIAQFADIESKFYQAALALGVLLCALGVIITSWAVLQYVAGMSRYVATIRDYIQEKLADPRFDRSAASEEDLEAVFEFSRREFQEEVDDDVKLRMRSWHNKNPEHLWIIYREGRSVVGYFAILPLNKRAARRVDAGELFGASISADDMVGVKAKPAAIYIGGIVAKSPRSKSFVVGVLLERLDELLGRGVPLYTRPVTKKGYHLVKKYGFIPVCTLDVDPPWKVVHKLVRPSVAQMLEPKLERRLARKTARQQSLAS